MNACHSGTAIVGHLGSTVLTRLTVIGQNQLSARVCSRAMFGVVRQELFCR